MFSRTAVFILLLVFICFPLTSFAQDNGFFFGSSNGLTSTSLGVVTLVVGVGLGVYTTKQNKPAAPRKVVQFLEQNKTEFRASLQLGSGAVLEDFSRLLGFEDKDTISLARLLRKNRKFVNEKAINELSSESVADLMSWIHRKMG